MKRNILALFCLLLISVTGSSQKFITKTGHIKFFSDGMIEKIEAHNRQVNAALDAGSGDFVFKVLMKSFEFEKALMQEHFNENYVESDKFPNATFVGKITNIKELNLSKEGIYEANVSGKLTIHGITRDVNEKGSLEVKGSKIGAKSKFMIALSDYDIKIPGAVTKNISKNIEITVDVNLDKLN